jgi:calcium/proton exchanger cax
LYRFIWYNAKSHDTIFDEVLAGDVEKDADRARDMAKAKFTLTECIIALAVSLTLVSLIAVALVNEIEPMVEEYGIPDNFMGLILVPLVEKAAEHLTAIDEAWDDQMVSYKMPEIVWPLTELVPCRTSPCSTVSGPRSRPPSSMRLWSFWLAGVWATT